MNNEAIPGSAEAVFHADGTINETFIAENYGLGIEEASQEVRFGPHNGTVAQMLADESCPIGARLHDAYGEKGIDGVTEVFEGAKMMDPNFSVEISEATLEREHAKQAEIHAPEPMESGVAKGVRERPKGPDDPPDDPETPVVNMTVSKMEDAVAVQRHVLAEESLSLPGEEEVDEGGETASPEKPSPEERDIHSVVADGILPPVLEKRSSDRVSSSDQSTMMSAVVSIAREAQPATAGDEPQAMIAASPAKEEKLMPSTTIPCKERVLGSVGIEKSAEPVIPRPEPGLPVMRVGVDVQDMLDLPSAAIPSGERAAEERITHKTTGGMVIPELTERLYSVEDIWDEMDGSAEFLTLELTRQVSSVLSVPEIAESDPVREAATHIIEALAIIRSSEESGEGATEARQRLVTACETLLDELGISYDQETVEEFTRLIMVAPCAKNSLSEQAIAESSTEDEGTHESKRGDLDSSSLLWNIRRKLLPLRELGKRALEASLAGA